MTTPDKPRSELTPQDLWPERVVKPGETPRALTPDEARQILFQVMQRNLQYYKGRTDLTRDQYLEGLTVAFHTLLDGNEAALLGIRVTIEPHPDDQAFAEQHGLHYFAPGTILNDAVDISNQEYLESARLPEDHLD